MYGTQTIEHLQMFLDTALYRRGTGSGTLPKLALHSVPVKGPGTKENEQAQRRTKGKRQDCRHDTPFRTQGKECVRCHACHFLGCASDAIAMGTDWASD